MDTRTGDIILPEKFDKLKQALEDNDNIEELDYFKEMTIEPTQKQLKRMKVGRNDSCPCGSGKKFKKCCLVNKHK